LRILSEANYFTPLFVEDFEKTYKLHLVVTEKPAPQALLREALSHYDKYDILEVPSFALKSFLIDSIFAPLDNSVANQFANISIDFHHLDFDPDDKYLV